MNRLSLILGISLLLSPGLFIYRAETSAKPMENSTNLNPSEQKSMTAEEIKMIETIKDIFKTMAEPGITSKALASRFGEPDSESFLKESVFPNNESFKRLRAVEDSENSNKVGQVRLNLAENSSFSKQSLKQAFGDYAESSVRPAGVPYRIVFNTELLEVSSYICTIAIHYSLGKQGIEDAKMNEIILTLVPKE
jgi:hypothetical protein